jgi:hypothetical protein
MKMRTSSFNKGPMDIFTPGAMEKAVMQLDEIIDSVKPEGSVNKYEEYARLKSTAKFLEEKIKKLETEIFEEVAHVEGSKLETKFATFSIMYRPKWQYSEKLTAQEQLAKDKLKVMKKEEELNGTAVQISSGGFLRCQIKETK